MKPYCILKITNDLSEIVNRFKINDNINIEAKLCSDLNDIDNTIVPLTQEFFTDIVKAPDKSPFVALNTMTLSFDFTNGLGTKTFQITESGTWYLRQEEFYEVILCLDNGTEILPYNVIKLKIAI